MEEMDTCERLEVTYMQTHHMLQVLLPVFTLLLNHNQIWSGKLERLPPEARDTSFYSFYSIFHQDQTMYAEMKILFFFSLKNTKSVFFNQEIAHKLAVLR